MGRRHLTIGGFSLMMSAVYAAYIGHIEPESPSPPFLPVSRAARGGARSVGRNIATKKNLNLAWQTSEGESEVTVNLAMLSSAVNLEDIDEVTSVDCTGQSSVTVTFADREAFHEARTAWGYLNDSFIMVTNHMGDCDQELERSFFVADSGTLASYESNLTIIAQAEKSDIKSLTSESSIDFTSTAQTATVKKSALSLKDRALSLKDGLTFTYKYSLAAPKDIFKTGFFRKLAVKLNKADIDNTIKFTGHAKWSIRQGVTEFYMDFHKSLQNSVDIEVKVTGPVRESYSWKPVGLTYGAIDIPGIITLGPSASISFGGKVVTKGACDLKGSFSSSTPNGKTHLDLINWKDSYSEGWDPVYKSDYTVSQGASITIAPFVAFTVQMSASLFNSWKMKVGVKAGPSFPYIASAQLSSTGNEATETEWGFPDAATAKKCEDGLKQEVKYQFSVSVFASKLYRRNLYKWKSPFWKDCLKWADASVNELDDEFALDDTEQPGETGESEAPPTEDGEVIISTSPAAPTNTPAAR